MGGCVCMCGCACASEGEDNVELGGSDEALEPDLGLDGVLSVGVYACVGVEREGVDVGGKPKCVKNWIDIWPKWCFFGGQATADHYRKLWLFGRLHFFDQTIEND